MPEPRVIPSIDTLLQTDEARALEREFGRPATLEALRTATAALRASLTEGPGGRAEATTPDRARAWIEAAASAHLRRAYAPSLRPVINATGVVIHTNLGRAPLCEPAIRRVAEVAKGYSNLEYDVERGRRGARDLHAERLLRQLVAADAAVVVNNNAAGVLLVLAALAAGREVLVSRGELVEIGGGFRVPDVMVQSGARLREVGTTNKTRAADYAAAIDDRTALILRVHPSNFRIEGFTERPRLAELVHLGQRFAIPVVEDLGSGSLGLPGADPESKVLADEPSVRDSVAAGVDVTCFSADKLLGGPQAGIVVGRRGPLDQIRRHPLLRALRVDKLTYAALEATLIEHGAGRAPRTVPIVRMLEARVGDIEARARQLATHLLAPGTTVEVIDGVSTVGGGSAPGAVLPTRLVRMTLAAVGATSLAARLRGLDPPVIARIEAEHVVLDLRTVLPEQDAQLAEALGRLASELIESRERR